MHVPWTCRFGTVPAGAQTDGATIPRILWIFASPTGWLFEAAVWHDYGLSNGLHTKAIMDLQFKELAIEYDTPILLANTAYWLVCKFSKGRYN